MLKTCLSFPDCSPFPIKELNSTYEWWELSEWCFTLSFLGVEWRRPFQGSQEGIVGFKSLANGWVQLWWKLNINPYLFRNICWAFLIPLFLQLWWNYPPFKNDTVGHPCFPPSQPKFPVWCMQIVGSELHVMRHLGFDWLNMVRTKQPLFIC